jgi:hypothetical protein
MNTDVLFKICVQLENRSEEILVHGYDRPEELCKEFTLKHSIPQSESHKLLQKINACIADLASPKPQLSQIITPKKLQSSVKNYSKKASKIEKPCFKHLDPSLKLLESSISRKKRCKLLVAASQKTIPTFRPEISKQ